MVQSEKSDALCYAPPECYVVPALLESNLLQPSIEDWFDDDPLE